MSPTHFTCGARFQTAKQQAGWLHLNLFHPALPLLAACLLLAGCPRNPAGSTAGSAQPRIAEVGGKLQVEEGAVRVDLNRSQVTDADLDRIARLDNLTILTLQHTGITDGGLMALQQARGLQSLDLANTQISDAGLPYLKNLKNLKYLTLNSCDVTEVAVEDLKKALPDTIVIINAPWAQEQDGSK